MTKANVSKLLAEGNSIKIFEAVLNEEISEDEYLEYFKGSLDSLEEDIKQLPNEEELDTYYKISGVQRFPKVYSEAFRDKEIGVASMMYRPEFLQEYGNGYLLLQKAPTNEEARKIYNQRRVDLVKFKNDVVASCIKSISSVGTHTDGRMLQIMWFKDATTYFARALNTNLTHEAYMQEENDMYNFIEDCKVAVKDYFEG